MQPRPTPLDRYLPHIGCGLLLAALVGMCLMPLLVVDGMDYTLRKLHLSPVAATLTIVGIFVGSLVNIPLYRANRDDEQFVPHGLIYHPAALVPAMRRARTQTIVAVNLGGCVIPAALAIFETLYILSDLPQARLALAIAVVANVAVCYQLARPLPGIGIALPAFVPVMVALGSSWLLLYPDQYAQVRARVAFVSGVAGPLIGADLLNLRQFEKLSAGVLSIGGAGTFDGIVVCSLLSRIFGVAKRELSVGGLWLRRTPSAAR